MWQLFDYNSNTDIDGNTSQITEPAIKYNPITTTASPVSIKELLLSVTNDNRAYQSENDKNDYTKTNRMTDGQISRMTTENLNELDTKYIGTTRTPELWSSTTVTAVSFLQLLK